VMKRKGRRIEDEINRRGRGREKEDERTRR
jgi:hypothetical protein